MFYFTKKQYIWRICWLCNILNVITWGKRLIFYQFEDLVTFLFCYIRSNMTYFWYICWFCNIFILFYSKKMQYIWRICWLCNILNVKIWGKIMIFYQFDDLETFLFCYIKSIMTYFWYICWFCNIFIMFYYFKMHYIWRICSLCNILNVNIWGKRMIFFIKLKI